MKTTTIAITQTGRAGGYSYHIPGPAGTLLAQGWRIYKTQSRAIAAVRRLHRRLTNGNRWRITLPFNWKKRFQPPDIYLSF